MPEGMHRYCKITEEGVNPLIKDWRYFEKIKKIDIIHPKVEGLQK
jgi:hypothetical protein